jgi:hypothetical protein
VRTIHNFSIGNSGEFMQGYVKTDETAAMYSESMAKSERESEGWRKYVLL